MRRLLLLLGFVAACQTPPDLSGRRPDGAATGSDARDARGTHDAQDARGTHDASPDRARVDGGAPDVPDGGPADAGFTLLGPPMVFAPTAGGFGLNAIVRSGDPATLELQVQPTPDAGWSTLTPTLPAPDVAQWSVTGAKPGARVPYRLVRTESPNDPLYAGSARTAPPPGTPFTFAMITDTHLDPRDPLPPGTTVGADFFGEMEQTMLDVMSGVRTVGADFLINLGDLLDYHIFGFNTPPPNAAWARLAYLNYRRLLGDTTANAAHFEVIGNWDGESGCNTPEEIARSTTQRLIYSPGPSPTTYAEGGSGNQDYYAFTWGDALFVVLNVMTYTKTCHLLDYDPGLPDDWTLGTAQLDWWQRTLASSTSKWKFTFIHHTVGGAAGNAIDTAYGRGGGQAAYVGEQATVHALLRQYGAQIFFYAHDHVFTDMVVDGIHYTLPGSAGAPWKFDGSQTGYTQYWPDSGYARVHVAPDQVQVDFVSITGQALYGFALP